RQPLLFAPGPSLHLRQHEVDEERIDVRADLALQLGIANVGYVERILVGLLDAGENELEPLDDVLFVGAFGGSAAGAEEGKQGEAGVADVRGVFDVFAFDAAAGVRADGGAPAAALVPAAVFLLLLHEIVDSLLNRVAERFGIDRGLGGDASLGD